MEELANTVGIRAFMVLVGLMCFLCIVALAAEPIGEDE